MFEHIGCVKLTVQIKLKPTPKQADVLRSTLETVNSAANRLSQLAWDAKEFHRFPLHKTFYRQIRDEFPLSAQIVCLLNAKVADAYKLDRKCLRIFRQHGSIAYDCRILAFKLPESLVSIWTVGGREKMPFVCGEAQRRLLALPRGEADLILRDRKWFLNVTVEVPEDREREATGWLGVDMGVVEIASTSDGQQFSGAVLNGLRARHNALRKKLQKKGTRSAHRLLQKRRRKEQRFATHTNHCISKEIVAVAQRTQRGIAIEDLTGIRLRIRANRKQRGVLHSWAFAQLGLFIGYKAQLAGVPVKRVDPRNTSRQCPSCGHISKKNRPKRDTFRCESCGHSGHADTIAAGNISGRASIIAPHESRLQSELVLHQAQVQNPEFILG